MNVMDAIKTRRSIRAYTDEKVSAEMMKQLLEAGFCAPSAKNKRPWEFIVIQDRETLNELAEYGKYYKMLHHAPCAILVCGDKDVMERDYLINDCSAATQNILLAAHELKLGACWLGVKIETMLEYYSQKFNLPENILPIALIAIGHSNEEKETIDRYTEEHVHYEKMGK